MNITPNKMVLGHYPTLGDDASSSATGIAVDPTLLFGGIAAVALAMFFAGGRVEPQRRFRGKRADRLKREISERKRRLKELEA
jgi:hypothetical protein